MHLARLEALIACGDKRRQGRGDVAPHAARRSLIIPPPTAAGSHDTEAPVTNAAPSAVAGSLPACSWDLSWAVSALRPPLTHGGPLTNDWRAAALDVAAAGRDPGRAREVQDF
jgi:hypothetical protein